jgi:hypothetical protein
VPHHSHLCLIMAICLDLCAWEAVARMAAFCPTASHEPLRQNSHMLGPSLIERSQEVASICRQVQRPCHGANDHGCTQRSPFA